MSQPDPLQQSFGSLRRLALHPQIEAKLLAAGQRGVEGDILGQVGRQVACCPAARRMAGHRHTARCRRDQPEDDLHQRRLAGAVVAQKRHALAGGDIEGDVRQRGNAAELSSDS